MSNFDFLRDFDSDLYRIGNRIETQVNVSPSAVTAEATRFLERVLTILLEKTGQKFNPRKEYYDQLDSVYRAGLITYRYKVSIYDAYQLRNRIHATVDEVERTEVPLAHQLHKRLFYIAKKLYRDFAPDYDDYKGVPQYRPVEIDTSDDEMELLEIPDFSEIMDVKYDYCVICGEPNHSNFSICCHKCNRVMDNANNFISIRNTFGKNATFTREDLLEYGIQEGYANQLINSLVREDMLKVRGRQISFNNMHIDEYLAKIDRYISVCELITKFIEDKITPAEIKRSGEYKQGSFKQEPYYQFYKLVNREIVKKFERYILVTRDISKSMEYTTISNKQLQRWYSMNLAGYKKGDVNESFVVFNEIRMNDYLQLKREGVKEKEIKKQLNITEEIYGFWCSINDGFEDEIHDIKIDLISEALLEGKTRDEIIEAAGVTAREYEDIVKVSRFRNDEFARLHETEVEKRKENLVRYLAGNDLKTACGLAKITPDDFYNYYDTENQSSEFFKKTTSLLMDKYLDERRSGRTRAEAIEAVGLKEAYVDRWLTRTMYHDFKDADLKVTVDLILNELKDGKSISDASESVGVDVSVTERFIRLGQRGGEIYRPLSDYYEEEILPKKLSMFLKENENKSMRKALESADLSEDEINHYYELGKSGDERYAEFYETLLGEKKGTYVYYIVKGKSHKIAMRESRLTKEEYEEHMDDLETRILRSKFIVVADTVRDKKTSTVAASKANCSVDEIYEWYFKGRDGEEEYEEFYEWFHTLYVRPNINSIQRLLDYKNKSLKNIFKANKDQFTKKDLEIWMKNGLLDNKILSLDNEDDEEEDSKSANDTNEILREMGVEDYDRITIKKYSASSGILAKNEEDIEELKRQILKK